MIEIVFGGARRHRELLENNWHKTDWTKAQAKLVLRRINRDLELLPQAQQAYERNIPVSISNGQSLSVLHGANLKNRISGTGSTLGCIQGYQSESLWVQATSSSRQRSKERNLSEICQKHSEHFCLKMVKITARLLNNRNRRKFKPKKGDFMASGPSTANAPSAPTSNPSAVPPSPPPSNKTCKDCYGKTIKMDCDTSSSSSFSANPVRYNTGEISLIEQDLSSEGFGVKWGHTRSYSNRVTSPGEGINGNSWFVKEVPYLANLNPGGDPNQATIIVIGIIQEVAWFDYDVGSNPFTYTARFFIRQKLIYSSANNEFTLFGTNGEKYTFHDFSTSIISAKRGKFKAYTDRGGRVVNVTFGANSLISAFDQTIGTDVSRYEYAYFSSGANIDRVQYVTYKVNGTNVRRAGYDYYDGTDANGSAGDLKRVTVQYWDSSLPTPDWGSTPLSRRYYRYYKAGNSDGVVNGLKYVLTPLGYARMVAAGITPELATNSQLQSYVRFYFKYNSDRTVKSENVNGSTLKHDYVYATSSFSNGYNNWKYKGVETLPNGSQYKVYMNFAGQVILKVFQNSASPTQFWYEYCQYDSKGRVGLIADSNSLNTIDETTAGLVTLKSTVGEIRTWEYYSDTSPGSNGAPGYPKYERVQQGTSGTQVKIRYWEYATRTSAGQSIYVLALERVYQSDASGGSSPSDTTYSYTWQGTSFQINQRTKTWPVVPTSQNGTGISESQVETFNAYGQRTSLQDERGYITTWSYDLETGGVSREIKDSGTSPHLNLTTDYTLDGLGRVTQELGPTHDIDIAGTSTNIRRAKWWVYLDHSDQIWKGNGYQKTSDLSFTLINPILITKFDPNRRITDVISATRSSSSGKLLPSDSLPQSNWIKWTSFNYENSVAVALKRLYFLIPSSGMGTKGLNYNEESFLYNAMKWEIRSTSFAGTITRNVYDIRGRTIKRYVGTNDANATDSDPTGGAAPGNNMVVVEIYEYDNGSDKGNDLLTKITQYVSASSTRVTNLGYDFRNRMTNVDGELDYYEVTTYDNLDLIVQVDRKNTTSSGNLITRIKTDFDNRRRIYQETIYAVDPTTGSVGNSIAENRWYDPAGNLIQRAAPGSLAYSKYFFDSVNRLNKTYEAYDSSGDIVMEQIDELFDAAGNNIQGTKRERFHDATGTGDLNSPTGSQPKARVSYTAFYPDALGRVQASAAYGTNGGSSFTRSATIPSRSDTILVTSYGYDSSGNQTTLTDPAGIIEQRTLDHAGRLTKLVEDSGSREISYEYGTNGLISTLTGKNSSTGDQTTKYFYGVTLVNSDVADNDLLRAVIYPDSSDTDPTGTDQVKFSYNRLQETVTISDQLGTVHTFEYDVLGRQIHDRITTFGPGIDQTVKRISRTYEVRGLTEKITCYDNATPGSGTILNEIQFTYNTFSHLIAEYQSHSGAVNTSTSPKVQYGYANGSNNTVRLTNMTYPSGRVLTYGYGSGGANDKLSRIESLINDDVNSTHFADYTFLGLERSIEVISPQPGTKLTYLQQSSGNPPNPPADGGDQYVGLDRFARIVDQRWIKTSTITDLERVQYGISRTDTRKYRKNAVAASGQDEYNTYDNLDRLVNFKRGTLNSGRTGLSGTPNWEEVFALDPCDNWYGPSVAYLTVTNGATDLTQSRTHNKANEITDISETLGPAWANPTYDAGGNATSIPQPNNLTSSYSCTYDGWKRLVIVGSVGTYKYDGLSRRITKDPGTGTLRHYYYSFEWQVLEERVGTSSSPDRQFWWGIRYIDDLVCRERNNGAERFYAMHDYFNCTAIVDINGIVQERYGYDAYGKVRFMTSAFASRSSSNYEWEILYGAYRWDSETGLYQVRSRVLHSKLGFWMTRDPLRYPRKVPTLYGYVLASPPNYVDPLGERAIIPPNRKPQCARSYNLSKTWLARVTGRVFFRDGPIFQGPDGMWKNGVTTTQFAIDFETKCCDPADPESPWQICDTSGKLVATIFSNLTSENHECRHANDAVGVFRDLKAMADTWAGSACEPKEVIDCKVAALTTFLSLWADTETQRKSAVFHCSLRYPPPGSCSDIDRLKYKADSLLNVLGEELRRCHK